MKCAKGKSLSIPAGGEQCCAPLNPIPVEALSNSLILKSIGSFVRRAVIELLFSSTAHRQGAATKWLPIRGFCTCLEVNSHLQAKIDFITTGIFGDLI